MTRVQIRYKREFSVQAKCCRCPMQTTSRCAFCLRPLCSECRYVTTRRSVVLTGLLVKMGKVSTARPRGPWICKWDCSVEDMRRKLTPPSRRKRGRR